VDQTHRPTLFVDLDGTIVVHNYMPIIVDEIVLKDTVTTIRYLKEKGYYLVLTTARTREESQPAVQKIESECSLTFDQYLYNLPPGPRYLINDYREGTPFKAYAINVERDCGNLSIQDIEKAGE